MIEEFEFRVDSEQTAQEKNTAKNVRSKELVQLILAGKNTPGDWDELHEMSRETLIQIAAQGIAGDWSPSRPDPSSGGRSYMEKDTTSEQEKDFRLSLLEDHERDLARALATELLTDKYAR